MWGERLYKSKMNQFVLLKADRASGIEGRSSLDATQVRETVGSVTMPVDQHGRKTWTKPATGDSWSANQRACGLRCTVMVDAKRPEMRLLREFHSTRRGVGGIDQ